MQTMVRTYKGAGAFNDDAQRLAREGWMVVSTSEHTRRSGCIRFLMLGGIGALVFKPKPEITVTYQRD